MYRDSVFKGEPVEKHVRDVLHVSSLVINTLYNVAFRKAFTSEYEKYSEQCSNDALKALSIPFRLHRYDLARHALLSLVPLHQDYIFIQSRMIIQLHGEFRRKFIACARKQQEKRTHMNLQRILLYITSVSSTQIIRSRKRIK